jgi:hypothetical protein
MDTPHLEFLVVVDSQEALEKAIHAISSKSGTFFSLVHYSNEEVGLGKIAINRFDLARIFDLGREYQVFAKGIIEAQKTAILPADPDLIQKIIASINEQYKWGKLKFLKSEEFEEDITHVYLERQDTGSLHDIFRLGYYYALELQKRYPEENHSIL